MVPVELIIRLANEGVPVQAIARATGWPYAELLPQLQTAQSNGDLVAIPAVDWPAGYPREQKLLHLSRAVANSKADLEVTIRRVFGLSERPAQILLLLLQHPQVPRERIAQLTMAATGMSNISAVHILHLRRKLKKFGLGVQTVHGYGYRMVVEQQRYAMEMIFGG